MLLHLKVCEPYAVMTTKRGTDIRSVEKNAKMAFILIWVLLQSSDFRVNSTACIGSLLASFQKQKSHRYVMHVFQEGSTSYYFLSARSAAFYLPSFYIHHGQILEVQLHSDPSCPSVCRSVDKRAGREVKFPCSYRSTCFSTEHILAPKCMRSDAKKYLGQICK